MNFIKPLAIALPVAIGTMLSGATVAQAGDDFADASAAFAAQFSTVNNQLNTANIAFDEAIAANHEMSVIEGQADTTFDAYVSAVDGITVDTVDESINAAASAYRNALMDYNTVVHTEDSFPSDNSASYSSADSAMKAIAIRQGILANAKSALFSLSDEHRLLTQDDVEGVTEDQVKAAEKLVKFGADYGSTFGATEYDTAKLLAVDMINVANGVDPKDLSITDTVIKYLDDIDGEGTDYTAGDTIPIDGLYVGSPEVAILASEIDDIRAAYEANLQVVFYDDPDGNAGEKITEARITAAEAIEDGGIIEDVTLADIEDAKALIVLGSINEPQILEAAETAKRDVITQPEYDAAVAVISTSGELDGPRQDNVNAVHEYARSNSGGDDTDNYDLEDAIANTEANVILAQAIVDSGIADEIPTNLTGTTINMNPTQAAEMIAIYEANVLIDAGVISQEEIDIAKAKSEREPLSATRLGELRNLVAKGPINVLTQDEFDAAKTLVNDVAGVETAVEAMEAAEAALIKAIKDTDDKAIKSAEKALESAMLGINKAISINMKVFDAINAVNAGTMSIRHFNEQINPDVGVAVSGALSGVTVVNNTITSHQNTIVASSGKYGLERHTGVNAGSTPLNTGVWLKAFGSDSEMDMRDGVAGYDADTYGIVIGIDQIIGNDMMVGIALSFAGTDVEGKSTARSITDTDQVQGTLYGTLFMNDFFINGSVAYAHSSSDTERTGFGGVVTGEYDTSTYSASVGAGMPIDMESYAIIPQITLAYSHVNPDEYTETGFGALNVRPESMDLFGIKAGVTINKNLIFTGGTLSPRLRLIADWDVLQEKAEVNSSWASTGTTVTPTSGPEPAALGGIFGAGVDYKTDDGVYVFSLDYDLSTRSDFVSHAASAQFRLNF